MTFQPKMNDIFLQTRNNIGVHIGDYNLFLMREGMNIQPELRERYENAIAYIEQWLRELEADLELVPGTLHGFHILFEHPRDLDSFVRQEDVLALLRSPTSEVGAVISPDLTCILAWIKDQDRSLTIIDRITEW